MKKITKPKKSIPEINKRIEEGKAVIMTAQELCQLIRDREKIALDDVDVVTSATKGLMSGIYIVLSFQVAERDVFQRAKEVWLNDIPAFTGPCPNERLGAIDLVVFGTAHSRTNPERYGGGHLFRDLVEGREINVNVKTLSGKTIETSLFLKDIPYAVMNSTRNCFKNYNAFVNPRAEPVASIFSRAPFEGEFREATFCGCGELNPLEKDPQLQTIGVGTRFLFNNAVGYITGQGTRSSASKPNLTGFADLHEMDPKYMGGFITSAGPETIASWSVPIPILNDELLKTACVLDEQIPLHILDVNTRLAVGETTYGEVWQCKDLKIKVDPTKCIDCDPCPASEICPTSAITAEDKMLDPARCFNCGVCVISCPEKVFSGELGALKLDARIVPIVLRQSDRLAAEQLAEELKSKILGGKFKLAERVASIR